MTHPALAHAARLVRGNIALRRALVVDTEEATVFSIRDSMKTLSNCDITVATSGEQAWRLFQQQPFDLLFADYKIPGADGMTLVERVRQSYPRTSIILTSAPGVGRSHR